ncbi:hypothetical protein ABT392_13240 [Paucibacter sp. JuS9]|uniref:hypothetical protein n=1 Tax=Paucibacter sp. JuS9 TaxID=3228748 RepID=UPI0037582D49
MSKFWRIAFAWLLAVALPIQGYAAQTMLLCGPANHHSSVMDDHAGQGHDHASMAHDDAPAHDHAEMSSTAADADKTPSAKAGHAGKCSVCSSCCNAAAITTSMVSFTVAPPDLPEVPTVKVAHDRVMVGGLDRPPRLSRT